MGLVPAPFGPTREGPQPGPARPRARREEGAGGETSAESSRTWGEGALVWPYASAPMISSAELMSIARTRAADPLTGAEPPRTPAGYPPSSRYWRIRAGAAGTAGGGEPGPEPPAHRSR